MPLVIVDAVYDELTWDHGQWEKDREVKAFLDGLEGLSIAETFVGRKAREERHAGTFRTGRGIGEAAIAEFMASGIEDVLADDEPVLLIFEDSDIRSVTFVRKPDRLHLVSTVALLRGLERCGLLDDANSVIAAMTNPAGPGKQPRRFADLPDGFEAEADGGSDWKP